MIPIVYEDFSGGENRRDVYIGLKPHDLLAAENVEPLALGSPAIRGRSGQTNLITGLSGPIRSLYRFYKRDGTATTLATYGTKVVKISDAGVETVLSSAFTNDKKFAFTTWTAKDAAYLTNGVDAVQKYDAVTLAALGGSPPAYPYIEFYGDRLWLVKEADARFTDLNVDNVWPAANALNISDRKGGIATGVRSLGDVLIFLKDTGLWRFQGSPILGGVLEQYSEIPCIAPWTVLVAEEAVVFLAPDGLYATDGFETVKISGKLDPIFTGFFRGAVGGWYAKLKQYWFAYSTSGGANDQLYVLTPPRDGGEEWSPWKYTGFKAESFSNWTGGSDTGQFYYGRSDVGAIRQADTGKQDVGSNYTCMFQTRWEDGGDSRVDKTLRYMHPIFEANKAVTYNVQYTFGKLAPLSGSLKLSSPNSVTWGPGTVTWGAGSVTWLQNVAASHARVSTFSLKNGKYVSTQFQNTGDGADFEFHKLTQEYDVKPASHTDLFAIGVS